ncbi:unnamed protein product [Notodromas monacha]|uniref:Uncharacterized protein n=1 Tax=Notodromas monacha TaxID=399045 RepID=A0A7R9BSA8_9CRUS|nr:unnamed protein product [Notodromas monacha]CAG0919713.1 unnamed protein product [Notodromas monacha]
MANGDANALHSPSSDEEEGRNVSVLGELLPSARSLDLNAKPGRKRSVAATSVNTSLNKTLPKHKRGKKINVPQTKYKKLNEALARQLNDERQKNQELFKVAQENKILLQEQVTETTRFKNLYRGVLSRSTPNAGAATTQRTFLNSLCIDIQAMHTVLKSEGREIQLMKEKLGSMERLRQTHVSELNALYQRIVHARDEISDIQDMDVQDEDDGVQSTSGHQESSDVHREILSRKSKGVCLPHVSGAAIRQVNIKIGRVSVNSVGSSELPSHTPEIVDLEDDASDILQPDDHSEEEPFESNVVDELDLTGDDDHVEGDAVINSAGDNAAVSDLSTVAHPSETLTAQADFEPDSSMDELPSPIVDHSPVQPEHVNESTNARVTENQVTGVLLEDSMRRVTLRRGSRQRESATAQETHGPLATSSRRNPMDQGRSMGPQKRGASSIAARASSARHKTAPAVLPVEREVSENMLPGSLETDDAEILGDDMLSAHFNPRIMVEMLDCSDNDDEHVPTGCQERKSDNAGESRSRRTRGKAVNYKEPMGNKKLRRGDPMSDEFSLALAPSLATKMDRKQISKQSHPLPAKKSTRGSRSQKE